MLEGNILMSRRERNRLAVLAQVKSGELTLVTAGEVMALTYRQAKRPFRREFPLPLPTHTQAGVRHNRCGKEKPGLCKGQKPGLNR
jgi:hypothetical protein